MKTGASIEEDKQQHSDRVWYHALTLKERLAFQQTLPPDSLHYPDDRLTRAHKRLEQWKRQLTFDTAEFFAERLEMDGITEQELLMLLAEPVEEIYIRTGEQTTPEWIAELRHLYEMYPAHHEEAPPPSSEQSNASGPASLLTVLRPLIVLASNRLRRGIAQIHYPSQELPFDATTVHRLFLSNLVPRLQQMVTRALILELHIARLEENLAGNTPEERFNNFIDHFYQSTHFFAFLEAYPLLARSLLTLIHNWADVSLEIVQHLTTDWNEIRRVFAQETDPGSLVEMSAGAGDTHRGGRSVTILRFSSGFQLVYKPRSLSLDQHFQEVLAWVNTLGITHPLRPLTILEAGNHGWVEFVQASSCTNQAEIRRFYERQGSYLALLYALEAADFHHGNILAAGEHPILVDLEALLHPHPGEHDSSDAQGAITQSIGYSVLRTGLLPSRQLLEGGEISLDISGLGGKEGQLTPRPLPAWKEEGTDQMHIQRERRELPAEKNRPTLLGEDVDVTNYIAEILKGFTEMYRILVSHQEEWLTQILPRFAQDEIRVILRPTQTYAILLSECFHPEYLNDTFERVRLFDNLWNSVLQQSYLRRVITAECQDLWQGDVPLFTTKPGLRDIFTSQGTRISDFCAWSGMELAHRRIKEMDERDLALQQWIIQASLVTTIMGVGDRPTPGVALPPALPAAISQKQLIEAASVIGNRLEDLAVHDKRGVNWLGIGIASENESEILWHLQEGDLTLYDGLPGIILFLSYLSTCTENTRYRTLEDMALVTLQEQIEKSRRLNDFRNIGAFSGLGSLIYLFTHLGALRAEQSFLRLAQEIVEDVEGLVEKDQQFDIIAGAAGCILCLLAFYHLSPSPRTLEVAVRCGDHLLSHAHELAGGLGWYTLKQETALAGFSHGGAGIALSLLHLAEVSKQDRFRQGAQAALTYERSLFSPEQRNWKRFAQREEYAFPVAWCHGAPGIGLARLASLPYLDDTQVRQEIQIALDTVLKRGFGNNQSLCHGNLGNLETLLTATQILDDPVYGEALQRMTALVFSSIQQHGWVTGVPRGVETPGFMTGLAGIGYELLRLAMPEAIPSVLLLAPPLAAGGAA